jgi:hypothetical protein
VVEGDPSDDGTVALINWASRMDRRSLALTSSSDDFSEFFECLNQTEMWRGVGPEFVVASADVLDQSVASYHDRRGSVAFESAHWPQSSFESAVIAFDAIVLMFLGVVKRVRDQLLNHCFQCLSKISDHLVRFAVSYQSIAEESASGGDVTLA